MFVAASITAVVKVIRSMAGTNVGILPQLVQLPWTASMDSGRPVAEVRRAMTSVIAERFVGEA